MAQLSGLHSPSRHWFVKLKSEVGGDKLYNEFSGEYALLDGIHNIVYTDYTGNEITKVGIQADDKMMLLHRTGGFSGDMLFDTRTDTVVKYAAFMVESGFVLHTYDYSVEQTDKGNHIFVRYGLNDGGDEEMKGEQDIEVIFGI